MLSQVSDGKIQVIGTVMLRNRNGQPGPSSQGVKPPVLLLTSP